MSVFANIDLSTATMEDLDNLSMDQLLGARLDEIDYANLLPTGTYVFEIAMDKTIEESISKRDAKPEEDKKASVSLNMRFRVVKVLACADGDVDTDSLVGRFHTERFALTSDFGRRNLATMICGILGVSPKDKAKLAEISKGLGAILEELREMKAPFAAQCRQEEKNGYENANIKFALKTMVSAEQVVELLD